MPVSLGDVKNINSPLCQRQTLLIYIMQEKKKKFFLENLFGKPC